MLFTVPTLEEARVMAGSPSKSNGHADGPADSQPKEMASLITSCTAVTASGDCVHNYSLVVGSSRPKIQCSLPGRFVRLFDLKDRNRLGPSA